MSYKEYIMKQLPNGLYRDINGNNLKELNVYGKIFDKIQDNLDDLEDEVIVTTAKGKGIEKWEESFKISVNKSRPYEERVAYLISKFRGNGAVTPRLIRLVSESYSNGEVEVIENYSIYNFKIKFIGTKGLPPNLDDLKRVIEDLKPVHLTVDYEITFITWSEFNKYNKSWKDWDSLNLTWSDFEKYVDKR